jgi:hypothetical protein
MGAQPEAPTRGAYTIADLGRQISFFQLAGIKKDIADDVIIRYIRSGG